MIKSVIKLFCLLNETMHIGLRLILIDGQSVKELDIITDNKPQKQRDVAYLELKK